MSMGEMYAALRKKYATGFEDVTVWLLPGESAESATLERREGAYGLVLTAMSKRNLLALIVGPDGDSVPPYLKDWTLTDVSKGRQAIDCTHTTHFDVSMLILHDALSDFFIVKTSYKNCLLNIATDPSLQKAVLSCLGLVSTSYAGQASTHLASAERAQEMQKLFESIAGEVACQQ